MIYLDNFEEIYSAMVAGAVPSSDGSPSSLMLVVGDILGTNEIHLFSHFSKEFRRIYYFAAPSRVFHSSGDMHLPLVAAIPGFPGHRGNGAYVCSGGGMSAAAIFSEGDLRFYANTIDAVVDAIAETGLPTFDVGKLEGELFESVSGRYRRLGEAVTRRLVSIYGVLFPVFVGTYVALSAVTGYVQREHKDDIEQRQKSLEKLVRDIKFVSPLHEQMARLQELATTVLRSGGWIQKYEFEAGQESFELMLPEWVTRDHISQLGGDVVSDLNGDGMVSVIKRKRRAAPVPAAAPSATSAVSVQPAEAPSQAAGAAPKAAPAVPAGEPKSSTATAPAKEPAMPTQAPFGSAASRPPGQAPAK